MNIYLFSITSVLETLWYSFITKLYIKKFNFELVEANNMIATQSVMGTILIPISALISQKYGIKNEMYLIGFVAMNACCLILIYIEDGHSLLAYVAMFLYAVFQAI
jgi:nitrate/nitrite transporter NarK